MKLIFSFEFIINDLHVMMLSINNEVWRWWRASPVSEIEFRSRRSPSSFSTKDSDGKVRDETTNLIHLKLTTCPYVCHQSTCVTSRPSILFNSLRVSGEKWFESADIISSKDPIIQANTSAAILWGRKDGNCESQSPFIHVVVERGAEEKIVLFLCSQHKTFTAEPNHTVCCV